MYVPYKTTKYIQYQGKIKQLKKCRELSDASFVTINFPKLLHKKFSFILQEFPFMKNKDTAYIMNFPLFNCAFSHRKTMNTTTCILAISSECYF